eukprot:scaffold108235_cov34-Prasinocladus_malaysianus.AAC.1
MRDGAVVQRKDRRNPLVIESAAPSPHAAGAIELTVLSESSTATPKHFKLLIRLHGKFHTLDIWQMCNIGAGRFSLLARRFRHRIAIQ